MIYHQDLILYSKGEAGVYISHDAKYMLVMFMIHAIQIIYIHLYLVPNFGVNFIYENHI